MAAWRDHPVMPAASLDRLAQVWADFAEHEARRRSRLYEELAQGVGADRELLGLLADLPPAKQQPNLLLAAVRLVCGTPNVWAEFRRWVLERREELVAVVLARRTQTNEPARCATLLPALARLPGPLALLEVGASAGLCLLPHRYAYAYGEHTVRPRPSGGPAAPTFPCRASASTPLPAAPVEVAWRAGLDLEPLDLSDPEDVTWLECLVWPGEGRRLQLLRSALAVARADPPRVVRGDLRRDLPALAAEAPADATLVVLHSAVLAYVPDEAERAAFADAVAALDAVWLANEPPGLLTRGSPPPAPWPSGRFLLAQDARPLAWTDPHGAALEWVAREAPARA